MHLGEQHLPKQVADEMFVRWTNRVGQPQHPHFGKKGQAHPQHNALKPHLLLASINGLSEKTLIVRLGRTFGHVMYATCLLAAIVVTGVLWQVYDASAWILLSLLAAPMMAKAFVQLRSVPESESQHLNPVLASTARNLLLYSVLLSLGLILGTAS